MKKHLVALAVAVTAGVFAVPAAALGVPGTETKLIALSERGSDGKVVSVPVRPGETVPVALGVVANGNISPRGAVVKVHVVDDVDLPRSFTNCWYFTDANVDGAWCELADTLESGQPFQLGSFKVTAAPDAHADKLGAVVAEWFSAAHGADQGGVKGLAEKDSGQDSKPVQGTGAKLGLERTSTLHIGEDPSSTGFAYLHLVAPSSPATTAPTTKPAATATTTAPAAAAVTTEPPASGSGGGLPVTGSKTAVFGGVGALLVLLGALAFLVSRRRTRFTA